MALAHRSPKRRRVAVSRDSGADRERLADEGAQRHHSCLRWTMNPECSATRS
jgi:hypothetical protein